MRHLFLWTATVSLFISWSGLCQVFSQSVHGQDASVVVDSCYVRVQPSGSGTFFISRKIKINSVAGALAHRVVKFDYDPLTSHAEFSSATVLHSDGSVDTLGVSRVCDYPAPAHLIYWGARQIMLEVGSLAPGDVLSYEIRKDGFSYALLDEVGEADRFVPPMKGQFYDIVPFWVEYPTERKVYCLDVPADKKVQFRFYHGTCSSSMHLLGDRQIFSFAVDDVVPFEKESHMADLYDVAPKLLISTAESWKAKSLWFHDINENYGSFEPTPEGEKLVSDILKGKKTEMEKISALTHWTADNIRYVGISMGEGEGYTLHKFETDLRDRGGVCKDIAGTLVSMLRIAGFEAWPAMTMAGSRIDEIPADFFNHCVVVVKLSDGTYMPLDPTWVPFSRELWSSAEQQQNYLPGIPEGSDLCLTPVVAPEKNLLRIDARNILDEDGNLMGTVSITAEGFMDWRLRSIFNNARQDTWRLLLEQKILAVSPKAKLLSVDYGRNPLDYQNSPIKITFRYSIPGYAVEGDGELALKFFTVNGFYESLIPFVDADLFLESRKYQFSAPTSCLVKINEKVSVPRGYLLVGGSHGETAGGDAASFAGSVRQSYAGLELNQELKFNKRIYDSSDWDDVRSVMSGFAAYKEWIVIRRQEL